MHSPIQSNQPGNSKPNRPIIAIDPRPCNPPAIALNPGWRVGLLMLAPHRLSFFLAMWMLMISSIWWAAEQWGRMFSSAALSHAMPPMVVHSVLMCFGFLPLFFAGFLFTAGPKWLQVEPPETAAIRLPLMLQAGGWCLWLAGGLFSPQLALGGGAVAGLGLLWMSSQFWRLVWRSRALDQIHARAVAVACLLGCVSLFAALWSLADSQYGVARAWVFTGLWGFIGVVYVVVAHRMIPFFTSSALPMLDVWRPYWVLWLFLGAMALKVLEVWAALLPLPQEWSAAWMALSGALEWATGSMLAWLAYRWGLIQSLKNRLLAMLHIGFAWIAVAFLLSGTARCASLLTDTSAWEMAALHAFTMGALGSLLLAMVTRVSCGHSGRLLHADRLVWALFCMLQMAAWMRIASTVGGGAGTWLLALAALLWALVASIWGMRLCSWYGKPRADGRPG